MSNFLFQQTPPVEARKLHPGVGPVVLVGVAAIIAGAAGLWLGIDIEGPKAWAVTLAGVVITVCITVLGFYRDRVQAAEHEKYMDKLREIDRKGTRRIE